MRSVCALACALLMAGCATTGIGESHLSPSQPGWTPLIDAKQVNQARYERDLAACRTLVETRPDTNAKAETKKGALRGGLGMAALIGVGALATAGTAGLAVLPALAGSTAFTVGGSAVAGGVAGKAVADAKYRSAITACLQGRGYHVVG